jgi:archaellum biogenesis ATPase FlaH
MLNVFGCGFSGGRSSGKTLLCQILFNGLLIDTEIAGKRTMISDLPNLTIEKLILKSKEIGSRNVRIAALKY